MAPSDRTRQQDHGWYLTGSVLSFAGGIAFISPAVIGGALHLTDVWTPWLLATSVTGGLVSLLGRLIHFGLARRAAAGTSPPTDSIAPPS
jgi:hypothetical protein